MNDKEKNRICPGTLYLVATPIGNLADISERACKVLSDVTFVAAEDTRNSAKLLSCLGIRNELVSYHEHNKKSAGEKIVKRLLSGDSCALITDAGMPAVSDPGEDLVWLCAEAGVSVSVIPGACAAVSALAISALPTGKFVFEGFLSAAAGERRRRLSELAAEERTIILYEAPHKLKSTLADMREIFGDARKVSLVRELTKINEEVLRMTLSEAVAYYEQREPRGEYVLITEGKPKEPVEKISDDIPVTEQVERYVTLGMSRMDAIKAVAKDRRVSKSEIYKRIVSDKN